MGCYAQFQEVLVIRAVLFHLNVFAGITAP
jgi:hypothetical protein